MIVPSYPGCVVPLEIFIAYKFGIGIFGGLNFGPGGFKVVRLSHPLKEGQSYVFSWWCSVTIFLVYSERKFA